MKKNNLPGLRMRPFDQPILTHLTRAGTNVREIVDLVFPFIAAGFCGADLSSKIWKLSAGFSKKRWRARRMVRENRLVEALCAR